MRMLILILVFLNVGFSQSIMDTSIDISNKSLVGEWILDLRPSPEAALYEQTLLITEQNDKSIKGQFYGSSIENGMINLNWEKLYFAFKTSDRNNDYFHSGYFIDDELFGITFCPKRNFVMPWTGKRK